MTTGTTFIYTDASFSKTHGIAVIGCIKFSELDHHSSNALSELEFKTEVITETNNIRSEIKGAIMGLESCKEDSKVVLYSDCHAVTKLLQRREKLERQNFISQSNGLVLNNADLYQKFYSIVDKLSIEINWIKGHSRSDKTDNIKTNFSYLDKHVRQKLRSKVLEIEKN